jgi:hypothetical protein
MPQYEQRLRLDSLSIDSDGILRATAKVARIGTQQYADGIDLRLPDDVSASLPSYDRSPITIDHNDGFVNPGNKDSLVKGFVTNARYVNGWVVVDLAVHASDAITMMQTTHQYFSVGYDATYYDPIVPGAWLDDLGIMGSVGENYPYDRVQKDITVNHVTITGSPRAGDKATILDSVDETLSTKQFFDSLIPSNTSGVEEIKRMAKIEYEDIAYEIEGSDSDKVAKIFGKMSKKVADFEAKTAEENQAKQDMLVEKETLAAKADALEAEVETLKQRDSLKLDADTIEARVTEEVNARLTCWATANKDLKLDAIDITLTVPEIQRTKLKEVYPKLVSKIDAEDNAVYLNALWDLYSDSIEMQATAEIENIKETVTAAVKADAAVTGIQAAQKAALARRTTRTKGVN